MNRKPNQNFTGFFLLLLLLVACVVNGHTQTVIKPPSDGSQPATNQSVASLSLNPVPILVPLYISMAQEARDKAGDAIAYNREALQLQPDSAAILNNLAWLLATASDARCRNGAEAISYARRACELTQYQEPMLIGTLAAAYAEGGQFTNACRTSEKAIELAETSGQMDLAVKNRQLLKLYAAGQPYRESSPHRVENLVLALFVILPFISGGLLFLFARSIRRRKVVRVGWPGLVLGNLLGLVFLLSFLLPVGEIYYRFILTILRMPLILPRSAITGSSGIGI